MKKTIFILFLATIWTQTTSTNISGFGEIQMIHDASSAGVGGSHYFSTQSNGFSLNSPSSLWKTKDVKLGFSTSFTNFTNNSNAELNSNTLNNISFTTPVGENQAMSFGVFPHTRSNFYIQTNQEDGERITYDDNIYAPAYTYHSEGGISRFFLSYSKLFDEGLSVGFTWYKNFGNLFLTDSVLTYQVSTNSETGQTNYSLNDIAASKKTHNFSGNSFSLEGRIEKDNHAIVVSTYWQSSLRVNTHYQSLVGNSEKYINRSKGISFTGIGSGYLYKINGVTGIAGEIHYLKPVQTDAELFGITEDRLISFNSGVFRRIANPKIGGWNFINLSTGVYSVHHKYSLGDITDYGLTFGLGIEYLNQKNVINLALSAGKKSGLFDDISDESYISLKVGFTVGEHWFVKRRRN